MGWPPEKYANALNAAEVALERALDYSSRQASTYPGGFGEVNSHEDRIELEQLLARVNALRRWKSTREARKKKEVFDPPAG